MAKEHGNQHNAVVSDIYRYALKGYAASIPTDRVAALRTDPRVEFVASDLTVSLADQLPRQPRQFVPSGLRRIGGDVSSTVSGDGKGSVDLNVAVIDEAVQPDHPDLNVVGGVDCLSGPARPKVGSYPKPARLSQTSAGSPSRPVSSWPTPVVCILIVAEAWTDPVAKSPLTSDGRADLIDAAATVDAVLSKQLVDADGDCSRGGGGRP